MMSSIKFSLNRVENHPLVKDGISFKDIYYVDAIIDGRSLFTRNEFKDAFIVYDELINSVGGRKKYLIFTCACGVADDGGWEGVLITKSDLEIKWTIPINGSEVHFIYDLSQYQSELDLLKKQIENVDTRSLEPVNVVFPEEWQD